MEKNTNFIYKNLSPFKWFVLENFPFLEVDFDALTEWQLFCKLGKEINKIIESQNLVGKQAEELTNAFNDLQNYFENLDVQEEINNKLDEMVENGTFENILLNYNNLFKIYNTTIDIINDNNLKINQKVKSLGYYEINDGGEGEFLITNIKNGNDFYINLSNNLYAKLLNKNNIFNILQVGGKCDNETDISILVNEMISFINKNGGGELHFPKKDYNSYVFSNIKLKYGVSIISNNATFKPSIDNINPMFKLDEGAITNINYSLKIKGLNIIANKNNPDQIIFDIHALNKENNGGGLWHSQIEDITIFGLQSNMIGINLYAQDYETIDNVNQYLLFNNVCIYKRSSQALCLQIKGQLGQTEFVNCEFNASSKELEGYIAKLESFNTRNDNLLGGIKFENTTFQNSSHGIYVDYATGLKFENCWFELLQNAITFENDSHIMLDNCHIAACGSENLVPFIFGEGSTLIGDNNYIQGTYSPIVKPINENIRNRGINPNFNMWNYHYFQFLGTTPKIEPTSTELMAYNNKTICYHLTNNTLLTTIKSMCSDSEMLTLYVDPSCDPNYLIRINVSSTDIILPHDVDNYAIHAGQSITLKPISTPDMNTRKWIVVSTTGVVTKK